MVINAEIYDCSTCLRESDIEYSVLNQSFIPPILLQTCPQRRNRKNGGSIGPLKGLQNAIFQLDTFYVRICQSPTNHEANWGCLWSLTPPCWNNSSWRILGKGEVHQPPKDSSKPGPNRRPCLKSAVHKEK